MATRMLNKCSKFVFEKYTFNPKQGKVSLHYSLDNKIKFTEVILIPNTIDTDNRYINNKKLIDKALFNLHLAGGISYWKTYCPQTIEIKSGQLTHDQAKFWENLYKKGLGEFYYKNRLNPNKSSPLFPSNSSKNETLDITLPDRSLLAWGGGKDSIVSAEILKDLKQKVTLFTVNTSTPQENTAKISALPVIQVTRKMSPNLKTIQEQVYTGHVPIVAYHSFIMVLVSLLRGFDKIILSCEKSANYENVKYMGLSINHQYDKGYEFEKLLSKYINHYITPSVRYFSLLRGWFEIKILSLFTRYNKYFSSFSSCNTNFKLDRRKRPRASLWCNNCPKCAFIFLGLAPFLNRETLLDIFETNLFSKRWLKDIFMELAGEKSHKPFECVGTPQETRLALLITILGKKYHDSYILKKLLPYLLPSQTLIEKTKPYLLKFHNNHNIPQEWAKVLKHI